MSSNEYAGFDDFSDIGAMMWEGPETFGQVGTWAEQDEASAALFAMEQLPAYPPNLQAPFIWPEYQNNGGELYPHNTNRLGHPFVMDAPLRPQAEDFVPNDIELQPSLPAYNEPLPRSAPPDIRVVGPDALPMPHPMSAMPICDTSRRRSHTNPHRLPPAFRHSTTEPEMHVAQATNLLSPVMADWVETEDALPQTYFTHSSLDRPSTRSPTVNSRASASPSGSRSQSRCGSRAGSRRGSTASSNRSSMNGDFECHHRDCGKRYTTMAKLNHHKRYHTPDHERPNVCDQCGARFLFKRELDRHKQSITHAGRHFFCTRCAAGFARADHLNRHIIKSSCSERAVTPSPTSVVHSTPSSNASSVPQNLRHRVSTGDIRSGTPNTDFSSSFPFGGNAFPVLPVQSTAFTDIDCDDYLDLNGHQWPPSPTPANDYFQFDSIPPFAPAQW
ncbi:hypothetical protein LTR27_010487 [Elasticomyces elasticus]|nr:hypothetical protein LTR27_010487 [Elasticomyces elasticus]